MGLSLTTGADGFDGQSTGTIPLGRLLRDSPRMRWCTAVLRDLKLLCDHLVVAQEHMKYFADKKRSERHFEIGDWVLQKY